VWRGGQRSKSTHQTNQTGDERKTTKKTPPMAALITDPYGPPVGAMSFDDTPFVVEVSDEFPAGFE